MITEKKVQSLQIVYKPNAMIENYLLVNTTSGTDFILTHEVSHTNQLFSAF